MFDIGWSEMLVIALVALVVLGPKELPGALKTFAYWMKQARKLAREFQSGIDDIVREAELDEAKKAIQSATSMNIGREIEKTVDPTGEIKKVLEEDKPTASAPALPPTPAAPPTPSVPSSPSVGNIAANGATSPAAPIPATPPLPETASTPAEAKS
jgi:sec-independent protein translocase protein TatB